MLADRRGLGAGGGCEVKKRRETDLVRACLDYLKLRNIFAWRNNTTGVFDPVKKKFRTFTGLKGVSDILGILPDGTLLAIECKMPGGKLTPEQKAFLQNIVDRNGIIGVANSVADVAAVIDVFLAMQKIVPKSAAEVQPGADVKVETINPAAV